MQELEAKTLRTPPLAVRIISAYEAGEIMPVKSKQQVLVSSMNGRLNAFLNEMCYQGIKDKQQVLFLIFVSR
jgi:hypothetical protein